MFRERLTRRFPALARLPPNAYVVGGAIRDLLLGREPADVDLAAAEPLACARSLGRKVISLGAQEHLRAYRVVDGEQVYDFAALLGGHIDVDLRRRDFTVNAMALDLATDALLDPHAGRGDVDARLVRMVAPTNFDDDPLRLLKAVRMAVKYDFDIEPATLAAICQRAETITRIAAERATYELTVIFSSYAFRRSLALLHQTALDVPLFGRELTQSFQADDVSLAGAFALLVDDPRAYAERWRWSDALLRDVLTLQRLLDSRGDLRVALYDAGEQVSRELPPVLRALGRDAHIDFPDFAVRPLLTGDEIASLASVAPGRELGSIKRALLEAQIREEVAMREEAEQFVRARKR